MWWGQGRHLLTPVSWRVCSSQYFLKHMGYKEVKIQFLLFKERGNGFIRTKKKKICKCNYNGLQVLPSFLPVCFATLHSSSVSFCAPKKSLRSTFRFLDVSCFFHLEDYGHAILFAWNTQLHSPPVLWFECIPKIHVLARRASPDAGPLALEFPANKTVRNKYLFFIDYLDSGILLPQQKTN